MKWAWEQALPSTQKFVLMALADVVNDEGVGWPSISTLAKRCAVSTRTVQRALGALIQAGLVRSDERHRGDGSTSSNRYQLNLIGSDTVTGASVTHVTEGCHPCQGAPDTDVTPRTTIGTVIDPSLLPASSARGFDSVGGDFRNLLFPSVLTATECTEAARPLESFRRPLAQQLLDTLDGRMRGGGIRSTPLAYLHGLIRRAEAGTFEPEVGPAATVRTSRVSPTSAESPKPTTTPVQPLPPAYPDVTSNPLCQRVAEIQEKVAQRRAASVSSEPDSPPARRLDQTDPSPVTRDILNALPARVKFPALRRVIGD